MMDYLSLTRFLYCLARISGCILLNPILGRRTIPGIVRGGIIIVFTVFVYPLGTSQSLMIPVGTVDFMIHALMEIALGALIGFVVHVFLYIPNMTGIIIDTQMGLTMNQIYDASSQSNASVTGMLLNSMLLLFFFAANGHHTMIEIILTSERIVPLGMVSIGSNAIDYMLMLFIECTLMAVKLSMPILVAEVVGQVGMGVLMKGIPQINVFSINIELKVIVGLALLFFLISPFSEFLLNAETEMLNGMHEAIVLAG